MYVLQSFLCPAPGIPEDLYHRGTGRFETDTGGMTSIWLQEGGLLSCDTFFGAFYRAYWWKYTAVRDIDLFVEIEGPVSLRVYETAGVNKQCIASRELDAQEGPRHRIPLPPGSADPSAGSRLYVEVHARGGCRVHRLEFVTDTPPVHRATLSIGLCTFNQEARLAKTLSRLAALADADDALKTVHVVNQGAPFESDAIRRILERPDFEGIDQRNLGGAGGFTRTLARALAAPVPASHHLLMDDDIMLDERLILRAMRFLDYAGEEIAVGAGMFDELHPSVMYEAGAFLADENRIDAYCQNADLTDEAEQRHFDIPVATDFNAWWFCALPLKKCREVGLPLPVFIRGDDFEYGHRLARAGVPTVTLPGIAVWHEPFYTKHGGWRSYYDLRNRLIFGGTHADKVRQLSVPHVVGMITVAILTHDYQTARMRLRAVEDYLMGPDALFARDPEELHKEVLFLSRKDAPPALTDPTLRERPVQTAKRARPTRMAGIIAEHFLSMLRTGLGPLRQDSGIVLYASNAHPANTAGRAYVLTNKVRGYHLHMVPRRGRMWALLAHAALTGFRFWREGDAAGRDWANSTAPYQSDAWWRFTFAGRGVTAAMSK